MSGYIDFHTHAFPAAIAATAIKSLEKKSNTRAYLNGTINGLLLSMDKAGIKRSVICSIATRVEQFQPILDWSLSIRSPKIIPLPSIHPKDPDWQTHLQEIKQHGFIGLKMHPYYQNFYLDDPALLDFYQMVRKLDLLLMIHTGYDIAYPRIKRADPARVLNLLQKVEGLRLITTHLGGWDDWESVRQLLTGLPVYMEISFALDFLDQIRLRDLLVNHPPGYILFGTDSPWTDQATTLKMLARLDLPDQLFKQITRDNGLKLLSE